MEEEKVNSIDLPIDGLMDEYVMLKEMKDDMTRLYNQTIARIDKHEQQADGSKGSRPIKYNFTFISMQTTNLNSIQKSIMDCIRGMNDIKKSVIDYKIKQHNINTGMDDSGDSNAIAAQILANLNKASRSQLLDDVSKENHKESEYDQSEDLMAEVISKLEDNKEEEKQKELKEEVNNLSSQDSNLKNLLAIYYNQIDVVFVKEDDEYDWIVIDPNSIAFEKEDVKELYPELYGHLKDILIERIDESNGLVYDTEGNRFEIAEY